MVLRFNKNSIAGQTHHVLTPKGEAWIANSWLFTKAGKVLVARKQTYAGLTPPQIVARQMDKLQQAAGVPF